MKPQLILFLIGVALSEDTTVKIDKGPVKGVRENYGTGKYYYSYKGIRYAKAPVDTLRFMAPVSPDPWNEVFDASEDGLVCPQYEIGRASTVGDEDCLFLNVYTPKIDNSKRAVIVYIHGGAFIMGSGSSYVVNPQNIVDNDVVVVTINYRLGALGFLAIEGKLENANNGIKDIILALKWVQSNIEKFGGDSNKVTLMGEDAGGAISSLLTLIPEAEGLFHGVIALSGNAICNQYLQSKPQQAALELASKFDCSKIDTPEGLFKCLTKQTQQDITNEATHMFEFFSFPRWFAPVVDGRLLIDHPETLFKSEKFHKVPFIIGHNKNDGAFYYRLLINSFNNGYYDDNFIDHKLPRILPTISEFNTRVYPVTRAVRKRYFVNIDMENEDEFRPRFSEFLTDLMNTRCTDTFGKILGSQKVPTYSYLFDYRGQYSIVNSLGEQVDMGVVHGDELQYIFHNIWGDEKEMSPSDTRFSKKKFIPLLTNFAKYSSPTPKITEELDVLWEPLTPTENKTYKIGNKLKIQENYKQEILKFWYETIPNLFKKKKSTKKDEL